MYNINDYINRIARDSFAFPEIFSHDTGNICIGFHFLEKIGAIERLVLFRFCFR